MFLAVVGVPHYGPKKEWFDGKVGIWPFAELQHAQRKSSNRDAATLEPKSVTVNAANFLNMVTRVPGGVLDTIKKKIPWFVEEGNDRVQIVLHLNDDTSGRTAQLAQHHDDDGDHYNDNGNGGESSSSSTSSGGSSSSGSSSNDGSSCSSSGSGSSSSSSGGSSSSSSSGSSSGSSSSRNSGSGDSDSSSDSDDEKEFTIQLDNAKPHIGYGNMAKPGSTGKLAKAGEQYGCTFELQV
jgi:hypothetical protein